MKTKKELEELAIREFDVLREKHGFSAAVVTREDWMTRIDFLKGDLAVELELDWREFDAFLLIVLLENGHLPKGYYVSNGQKCRKHLLNIMREQKWPSKELPKVKKSSPRTDEDLQKTLLNYKTNLLECVEKLEFSPQRFFE